MTTLILTIIGLLLATAAGVAGRACQLLRPSRRLAMELATLVALMVMERAACVMRTFSQAAASEGIFALIARVQAWPPQRFVEPN